MRYGYIIDKYIKSTDRSIVIVRFSPIDDNEARLNFYSHQINRSLWNSYCKRSAREQYTGICMYTYSAYSKDDYADEDLGQNVLNTIVAESQ